MPSQLPSTDCIDRKVNTFGNGAYDELGESEYRNEGDFEARGESLPTNSDIRKWKYEPDTPYLGDIFTPVSDMGRCSSTSLPGDTDRPARSRKKPEDDIVQDVVPSVAESQLPHDSTNPPARSDYYDRTKIGESMLPGAPHNDQTLDRFLGAFGNMWSGWELDDVSVPTSFPGTDRPPEEADKYTSVPMGLASGLHAMSTEGNTMKKISTNLDLVGTLASDFLKKTGKKDGLTRRHVMAFLQEGGYHQYLASDVIRCLSQRHGVFIADVLDQFPISNSKLASTYLHAAAAAELIDIRRHIASVLSPDRGANSMLRRCGDNIMELVDGLVRGLQDD